jgi:hypothetical protein
MVRNNSAATVGMPENDMSSLAGAANPAFPLQSRDHFSCRHRDLYYSGNMSNIIGRINALSWSAGEADPAWLHRNTAGAEGVH